MYALIENDQITRYFSNPTGFTLNDIQYPADIFTKWSAVEKEAIGIVEVIFDDSNKKDKKWYINTNQSFTLNNGVVTASYGTATPKAHEDTNEVDGEGVVISGLKTELIKQLKIDVANELAKTDWYIIRKTEVATDIPSAITTHRDLVRSTQVSMEAQITDASDTAALVTLHTFTTDANGIQSKPLGTLPTLEI